MKEHMTLGDKIPSKRKSSPKVNEKRGPAVKLENSKYLKKTEKNPWREIELSEANLIAALEFLPVNIVARNERIERVIVGEPANGIYPLSIAVIKKKETVEQE